MKSYSPPNLDTIPPFLRDIPHWVVWDAAKKPHGRNGSPLWKTPSIWMTFPEAVAAYQGGTALQGVGFVLAGTHDLIGVDLDKCVDTDVLDGSLIIEPWASEAMTELPGYWELSPSGTGLRGFFLAPGVSIPRGSKKVGSREIYSTGRYLTVTGRALGVADVGAADMAGPITRWLDTHMDGAASPATSPVTGDAALDAFVASVDDKAPLADWPAPRIRAELFPHLIAVSELSQEAWIRQGMILHHQFSGSDEGRELWRELSSQQPGYDQVGKDGTADEVIDARWPGFDSSGARAATLRALLHEHRDALAAAASAVKTANVQSLVDRILGCPDQQSVADVAAAIAADASISDLDREVLAHRILAHLRTLLIKVPIASARKMVKLTATALAAARNVAAFPDVSPQGVLQATEANLAVLCMNEGVTIRYNVIGKDQELIIPGRGFTKDNRANASLAVLSSMCAKANLNTGAAALRGLITAHADANQHNPVLQWIESKAWDGKDRVAALDATIVSHMNPALKRKILDHWLVQCVAAAAQGGLQVRGVLVFQGGQYQGKSRWLASLAPEHLHAVSIGITLDPRDKDLVKQALSFWLVELGELDATFRKSDIAHLKGFLSRTEDVLRLPYAQAESKFDRRTVFFGTVNDPDFLNDTSGNTRFWTIPVETVDHEHTVDMQQLWAQVLADWRTGRKHYPTAEIMREFEAHNTAFVVEDPTFVRIANGFPWPQEGDADRSGWAWWSATEVLRHLNMECRGPAEARRAGAALRKLNGNANRVLDGVVRHQVPPVETPL